MKKKQKQYLVYFSGGVMIQVSSSNPDYAVICIAARKEYKKLVDSLDVKDIEEMS